MLVGMGFVYAFLGLMIFVIKVFIAPLATRFPDEESTQPRIARVRPSDIGSPNATVVAAISAAVTQHRKNSQGSNRSK